LSVCRLLVHNEFLTQYLRFQVEHEDASESLATQVQRSRDDPASRGRLGLILNPRLEGRLYKLWVAGPQGYRYVYFHDPVAMVTLPIFLSLEPRKDFNWDSAPFAEVAERIVSDFDQGCWDNFSEIKVV